MGLPGCPLALSTMADRSLGSMYFVGVTSKTPIHSYDTTVLRTRFLILHSSGIDFELQNVREAKKTTVRSVPSAIATRNTVEVRRSISQRTSTMILVHTVEIPFSRQNSLIETPTPIHHNRLKASSQITPSARRHKRQQNKMN